MKKYLILSLLLCALIITACTRSNENESDSTDTLNNPSESESATQETETEAQSIGYVDYTYLEVSNTPEYDSEKGILTLYFTDYIMWKNTDIECTVGIIGDEGAASIAAHAVYDEYPEMRIDSDLYSGVALKLSETLAPGSYRFVVVFGTYRAEFEYTVE